MSDLPAKIPGTPFKHLLIGLTGGIGSGKSTVASLFEQLGARVIDTDELSRGLTQPGGLAIPAIRDTFGADFIDAMGALDRLQMRELIFSDHSGKRRLEAILHPLILKQARQLTEASTNAPYTLLVVPLLLESKNYKDWINRTLVVDCPEDIQIARTMQRSGLNKTLVQAIMDQQMGRSERVSASDDIITNDSDLAALSAQVDLLHRKFLTIATGSH